MLLRVEIFIILGIFRFVRIGADYEARSALPIPESC